MERRADLISDKVEVVPVVVLSQTFPARPSSIPDIRDFVRRCLSHSPLSEDDNREVGETVAQALLEAAVERAVGQTMGALHAANLDDGPPVEALERLLAAAWRHLARYSAMAQAVAEQLSPEAVSRTHQAAHHTLGALLERGRADGSFRSDLPVGWLVTTCIAVIHACAAEVREGRLEERDAVRILTTTIRDLFTGGGQVPGGNA